MHVLACGWGSLSFFFFFLTTFLSTFHVPTLLFFFFFLLRETCSAFFLLFFCVFSSASIVSAMSAPVLRPHDKKIICNMVLSFILVMLSAFTFEYNLLHESTLSGTINGAVEGMPRFGTYPDDLYSFVARQQAFLAGDGKHSCITLAYYPFSDTAVKAARSASDPSMNTSTGTTTSEPPPAYTAPLEAVRLRSSIVLREGTQLLEPSDAVPWRVQTERLGISLNPPPRTTGVVTREPRFTTSTTAPTTESSAKGLQFSSLLTSGSHFAAGVRRPVGQKEEDKPAAAEASQAAPRRANAVILLMSPTFSSETVPTFANVDSAPLKVFRDAEKTMPGWTDGATARSTPMTTATPASPTLWRCRRCQQFLETLLPSLERAYLRRYPYPVHILHRGIMPSEVVLYITTVLPSATSITIEDVSGVLSERVTLASTLVLEPWLKEMSKDLQYRRRFTTFAPAPMSLRETTQPKDTATTAIHTRAAATRATGVRHTVDGARGAKSQVSALTIADAGGDDAAGPANGGVVGGGANNNNKYDAEKSIASTLRERWEMRRLWTGLLFLLPSLKAYDYFWYIDSQSHLTKVLERDVLTDVANHTCAVAYHKLSYLTHKRVTGLWSTVLAWNEQSANHFFSAAELQRALSWLSDERSNYGGKTYSSDCVIMSFAITRHPAYINFFHWIDSRPPYGLMTNQWSPLAVYTVFAELLMEKHGWDSCLLDPFSGFRSA